MRERKAYRWHWATGLRDGTLATGLRDGTLATGLRDEVTRLVIAVSTAFIDFGYYSNDKNYCPGAEDIVKDVVKKYVVEDSGFGAGLIRMFFHDCFVRGCDASILLDSSDLNPTAEKWAIPNNPSLRGFEVIDEAKKRVEEVCPGVVSCADIIAFAARDATFFLSNGNIRYYEVKSGRRDGRISNASEVLPALPAFFHTVDKQKELFAKKGLSTYDLVTLVGAHSIGRSHCSSFTGRLYPDIDRNMDQTFALNLRKQCLENATVDGVVVQDLVTPDKLDNQYYKNVNAGKALFISDWSLVDNANPDTKFILDSLLIPGIFEISFPISMHNMGNIDVKTGTEGEIRKFCNAVNPVV
ncbi:peroxidase 2-like [Carex rostrata]